MTDDALFTPPVVVQTATPMAVADLVGYARNSRTHSDDQVRAIARGIRQFGWTYGVLADASGVVAGHGRILAAELIYAEGGAIYMMPGELAGGQVLPHGTVPVVDCTGWTDEQRRAYVIWDNRSAEMAGWDAALLRVELEALDAAGYDLDLTGFPDLDNLDQLLGLPPGQSSGGDQPKLGALAEAFGVPPFSVLNARDGWWRDRKRAWLAMGIQSELGRGEAPDSTPAPKGQGGLADQVANRGRVGKATSYASQDSLNAIMGQKGRKRGLGATPTDLGSAGADRDASMTTGTSIFDPVLCELAYRWFCPPGGQVLDPFAGGSVRGLVASWLGRDYLGMDLSGRQLEANRDQAKRLLTDERVPVWVQGDSRDLHANLEAAGHRDTRADFLFTCPPYADLEIYSDDPADLSNMEYADFLEGYRMVLAQAARRLRDDRFAAVVVGEVRDSKGHYRDFVGDTVQAMRDAGLEFYNEAILVTSVGSLPVRAGKQFQASRKMGKTHQNVLVFVKGSWRKATAACGQVEFGAIAPEQEDEPQDPDPEPGRNHRPVVHTTPAADQTPVQPVDLPSGRVWVKRDDLFDVAGVQGGKVRSCWRLAQGASHGLITAGSRASPQVNIVAHVAKAMGLACRVHVPTGKLGPELLSAQAAGAEVVQHRAGYNSVIIARARADAQQTGWREIPFGMECREAVEETAAQVPARLPQGVKRLVMPVGSGMSLAGVLWGLLDAGHDLPVVGVVVGADPTKRLDAYAPPDWRDRCQLEPSGVDYHRAADQTLLGDIQLDPIYEAKCLPWVQPGDLFWIVGVRETAGTTTPPV